MSAKHVWCHVCMTELPVMKRCTRCLKTYYCSKECQIKDWNWHKTVCLTEGHHSKPSTEETPITTLSCNESKESNSSPLASQNPPQEAEVTDFQESHEKGRCLSYLQKDVVMYDVPKINLSCPLCKLIVRHNKNKDVVVVHPSWTGVELWKYLSSLTSIPYNKLQLIHKGRKLTTETAQQYIKEKAVFLAIGDPALPEDDVDTDDVSVLMKQLNISRNEAVKALQKNKNLIDAMLDIGGK